ncbi:MAG TPA: hypothetical protein VL346_08660 [Acidobacteriaceae bacterium]|nr:hypothetical protein [Acidobacteriaceae bacterium]
MMRAALSSLLAVCLLSAGAVFALQAEANSRQESPDTQRILAAIEKNRDRTTPADRQAAHRLNIAGDQAYRRHHYTAAFTAYSNSYPNAPTAHAYILAGDSHWRDVVQNRMLASSKDAKQCSLDSRSFAHDLALDLAQNQAVGLRLAEIDKDTQLLNSTFYHRARETEACLASIAQDYSAKPPDTCVDLKQLQKCLGPPLLP